MEADSLPRAAHARPTSSPLARVTRVVVGLLSLYLAGCVAIPEQSPREPLTAIPTPVLERLPPPAVEPPPAPRVQPVAIVVSSRLPAYMDVAEQLVDLLDPEDYVVHVLDDASEPEQPAPSGIAPRAAVAIGLQAALYARRHIDAPLIFCQVLNYAEYPELAQATAAVSMLTAFDQQLEFWKALDESLEVVGTIVGPGHEALLSEAVAAADSRGMTLDVRISASDRETVYQFKRLSAEIDGFWLIPDNRVLSVSAIEDLMAYAAARRLPVVVSTPELLRFGALMSLAPTPAQIADSVFAVLSSLQRYVSSGFELVSPRAFEVDVNRAVASRLGLRID